MERVYFVKASKKELKFAAEAIDLLMSQKVKLNMRSFLGDIEGLSIDEVNICNTSCCIAGAHAMHFNKQLIVGGSYLKYLEKVGIEKNGYFEKFVLSHLWPKNDVQHAVRRLSIIKESGFVPCISILYLLPITFDTYDPTISEWRTMRRKYGNDNILPLLEAKIDLLKSIKSRNKLLKVKFDKKLYFGVDI